MDIVELAERTLVRHAVEGVLDTIRFPKMEALSNARFGRGCAHLGPRQFVAISHEIGALPVVADLERIVLTSEMNAFAMMLTMLVRLVVALARHEIGFDQYLRAVGVLRATLGPRIVQIEKFIHVADLEGERFVAQGHG